MSFHFSSSALVADFMVVSNISMRCTSSCILSSLHEEEDDDDYDDNDDDNEETKHRNFSNHTITNR